MTKFLVLLFSLMTLVGSAQQTQFELSNGKETATYFEAVDWYKNLDAKSPMLSMKAMGPTDAGYPLHLVLISTDGQFNPNRWHEQNKLVILVNNGIHPGEPDGIDASMMLARDICNKKISLPSNVVLGIIPIYNIGGSLNRNSFSRVNQDGPVAYGFRGNAQNLDLNRDFTKCDSREAKSFSEIFHFLDPDILVDNHVSDGADFQHTMTLITTQYDKLGPVLGSYLKKSFEPKLYAKMAGKGWDMIPYVDFETTDFDKGMKMFMDPPRYSSGYAALFNTLSFMPETHMLKPFKERVSATYDLLKTFISEGSTSATEIKRMRLQARLSWMNEKIFPLKWTSDSSAWNEIIFKGYQVNKTQSAATGLEKMYYDHNQAFTKKIKFYNGFKPAVLAEKPKAYIIPQGWYNAIDLLKLNKVKMSTFQKDTTLLLNCYRILDYKSGNVPYEKHHKNSAVSVSAEMKQMKVLKGDYIIYTNQPACRYLVEMLEPTGDDSFFAWNFFDAILQQKEGYSDYRWEDIAAEVLKNNPDLQKKLADKKSTDPKFAADPGAILDFIYKNSAYYEKEHRLYPVYRVEY